MPQFDPTIQEALEIILERYELTMNDKLTSLRDNKEAMTGVIKALGLALRDNPLEIISDDCF